MPGQDQHLLTVAPLARLNNLGQFARRQIPKLIYSQPRFQADSQESTPIGTLLAYGFGSEPYAL
jgi:hypothetical protein